MHEALRRVSASERVLDLGCDRGSFPASACAGRTTRADAERPAGAAGADFVQCRAEALPFRAGAFRGVVSNHSLEHFERLDEALAEVARVLDRDGWFYAAVPDASTLTDRIYRWMGRGGGHVNAFRSPRELIARLERELNLPYAGGRELYTSLSFLNRRNIVGRPQRKLLLFANGSERLLEALNWIPRRLDRLFGSRLAVYGWCFYFGRGIEVERGAWTNVCVRCGAGHRRRDLEIVAGGFLKPSKYRCPGCGALNWAHPEPPSPES